MITNFKTFNEMAYTRFEKNDDVLPKEMFDKIKSYFNIKQFKRLGSGRYGTAFKISNTKVLKITTDLKEYEYAKKLVGVKNSHIADIYNVYHFKYDNGDQHQPDNYAIIIKEYCRTDEYYFDKVIDSFLEYTGNEMSLSYISSEYLHGDVDKKTLNKFFKRYKDNNGYLIGWMEQWYRMIEEIKKHKIYVKDFNGSNVGTKPNGDLAILELGLGYTMNVKLDKNDEIIL